jgi:small conductance mechanosensitive channel
LIPVKRGQAWLRIRDLIVIAIFFLIGAVLYYLNSEGAISTGFVLPIYAVIILVIGYAGIRIISAILEKATAPRLGFTRAHGINNFFQVVSGVAIFVIAFAILGFNLTGVLIGAGFLGIVLGLAAQQVLGNLFAGLSMLASRPFEIGDRVTLSTAVYAPAVSSYPHESEPNGFTGVVTDIGIFYTYIQFDEGTPAIFPNSVVVGSLVINHSRVTLRAVRIRLNLDKNIDFDEFKTKTLESLKKHDIIDAEKSSVEIVDVGDTTYQVALVVWARSSLVLPVKTIIFKEALKVQEEFAPKPDVDPEGPQPLGQGE